MKYVEGRERGRGKREGEKEGGREEKRKSERPTDKKKRETTKKRKLKTLQAVGKVKIGKPQKFDIISWVTKTAYLFIPPGSRE